MQSHTSAYNRYVGHDGQYLHVWSTSKTKLVNWKMRRYDAALINNLRYRYEHNYAFSDSVYSYQLLLDYQTTRSSKSQILVFIRSLRTKIDDGRRRGILYYSAGFCSGIRFDSNLVVDANLFSSKKFFRGKFLISTIKYNFSHSLKAYPRELNQIKK